MEYKVRKFTKKYEKAIVQNARKEIDYLKIELKHLEKDLKNYQTSQKYLDYKSKLDSTIAEGVRIRGKCDSYEIGEKSNKFFLNFKKTRAPQGLIRTLVTNEKEINDPVERNTELQHFIKSSSPIISLFQNKMWFLFYKICLYQNSRSNKL